MKSLIDRIKRARVLTLSLIVVVALGVAIALVTVGRAQLATPEEILLSADQQQPVRLLLAEQLAAIKQTNQVYQERVNGAIAVLRSQTSDPLTGKPGLKEAEWYAVDDGNAGFKFVSKKAYETMVQAAQERAKKAQQGNSPQ